MKTVNVPQIGGLDNLLAILAEPDRFKKHLEELKSAHQELADSAGGVDTLRDASKIHNIAKSVMAEADAALTTAREEANSIRSRIAQESNEAESAKKALAEKTRVLTEDRAALDQERETLSRDKAAWNTEEAERRAALEALEEKAEQRTSNMGKRESVMRKKLKAAAAAMDA